MAALALAHLDLVADPYLQLEEVRTHCTCMSGLMSKGIERLSGVLCLLLLLYHRLLHNNCHSLNACFESE